MVRMPGLEVWGQWEPWLGSEHGKEQLRPVLWDGRVPLGVGLPGPTQDTQLGLNFGCPTATKT